MFKNILSFSLTYRMKRISTYIYFVIFLLLGFMCLYRGSFGSGPIKHLTGAGIGNINANAPYALYYLITILSNYGLLITAAFFGNAAYKDFKDNTFGLYFSYPIKKINYLAGRFSAAFISTLFVFSGLGIGAFIATISPYVNPEKIGPINIFSYIHPYLIGVIPNIIFAGILFFSLALITRKFFPIYTGIIAILISYMLGVSFLQNHNFLIASLIDSFGHFAARSFSDYWTVTQKNTMLIPLSGNLLANRILWLSLGIIIFMIAYKKFRFTHIVESKKRKLDESKQLFKERFELLNMNFSNIKTTQLFNLKNYIRQMLYTSFHEFNGLIKNIDFIIILFLGLAFIFIMGFRNVGLIRGTQTYPVTFQVLDTTQVTLYLFTLVIIFFCSGELVWRERNKKFNEIYDALPIPEWVTFMGKLGAIVLIQVSLMLVILLSGIMIQVLHGYYKFELGLYLRELFGMRLPYYLLISAFAMFVQVVVNKKFLGYVVTLLLVDDFMPALGFEHHLFRFASTPTYTYSDMNGYGPFLKPIFFFNLYWIALSVILIVLAILLWVRGNDKGIVHRIKTIKPGLTKSKLRVASASFLSCIIFGAFIIYNTNFINKFETTKKIRMKKVAYEKNYKKYENTPQPTITDIKMSADIYPDQRKVTSQWEIILKNKTEFKITEIFIQLPRKARLNKLCFNRPYSLKEAAKELNTYIYYLNQPLLPDRNVELKINMELSEHGFKNNGINTRLVKNGTFLNSRQLLPIIGYDPMYELEDNDKRKKYGLDEKERIPSIENKQALMSTFLKDADWINFEAIISTTNDQIALTTGELLKEWIEEDRHYFHYKTSHKVLKYLPLISAKYKVKRDQWQDIAIEIYYHQEHDYNLDLMMKSIKKSLAYFTENFSPYQFKNIKIVEFPRYEIFAEGFPNLIPISEGYGFIAKYDNTNVDYIYRVIAHEVGHQWWAHQVIGAYVQGLFVLTEVMAQYSALMVAKNEYDQKKINKYVKFELDRYLRGRGRETREEVPLMLSNMSTWYLNYAKGFVVMNALQDYIGEDNLNAAIKKYIQKVAYQEPPYTTSLEFLEYLRDATPDSLKYIITDMFETITLYENKALKATHDSMENGKYRVKLAYEANKFRADKMGKEQSIKINDYITFGVFGADGKELYLEKHFVNSDKGELEIIVDEVPDKAGIDPYYYLIDKHADDNVIDIEKE